MSLGASSPPGGTPRSLSPHLFGMTCRRSQTPHVPSGENATAVTLRECPWKSSKRSMIPVFTFQFGRSYRLSQIPRVSHHARMQQMDVTQLESPSTCSTSSVAAFQIRIDASREAETTRVPSPENAADVTSRECSPITRSIFAVFTFQILTELSSKPDTTSLPSGENTTPTRMSLEYKLQLSGIRILYPK